MKNQERVWKAEQAKAHEDKKIEEFQREMREEREREELQRSVKDGKTSNKMDWMYQVIIILAIYLFIFDIDSTHNN